MFDKDSWINSYATIALSWGTSTLVTFNMYMKQVFDVNVLPDTATTVLQTIAKSPVPQNTNDIFTSMTWITATGLAIFSGWSRWNVNRADARLKNAEAEAIEKGYTQEAIDDTKTACKKEECFFIEFYTKYKIEEMEEKMKQELEEKVKNELRERKIKV